jgi:hypothetical protein
MADRQKTTDLTPEAEKGEHDLMEIRDKEKPKRPRARPVDLTPEAEKGEHDLLEVILGESGRTISDNDRKRVLPVILGESGRTISDNDRKRVAKVQNFRDGGAKPTEEQADAHDPDQHFAGPDPCGSVQRRR